MYSIDYYLSEYKWESKQPAELVADLTTEVLDLYDPAHGRRDVAKYAGYFLGNRVFGLSGPRSPSGLDPAKSPSQRGSQVKGALR
jgi:hypothetical protein